jgi:signal transduction histidine kinase
MAMASIWFYRTAVLNVAQLATWWRGLPLPLKAAVGASGLVVAAMAYLGAVVAGHARENVLQRRASAAALYMSNFVERHIQELESKSTLSDENRAVLEGLLSPASMHRPIIAFRIWKGDTVAFSNERDLIGRTFARTAARELALQGQVALEFEQPDGDDDEQVRSLRLPVLEVYAPVRQGGTNRIIALVETYEIGVELKHEVWVHQLSAWAAVLTVTLTIVILLFSMARSGEIERSFLMNRMGESERRRRRVSEANLQVCAMNDRSLRSVGTELNEGPGQYIALALLKFEALEELVARANAVAPLCVNGYNEDLKTIREALNATLQHIRGVYGGFPPADIERLSLRDTLDRAAARHERRTGVNVKFESHGLPDQLPFPLKTALYHFTLEGLSSTYPALVQSINVFAENQSLILRIAGGRGTLNTDAQRPVRYPVLEDLRNRIEALGGALELEPTRDGGMSIVAELNLADVELARD